MRFLLLIAFFLWMTPVHGSNVCTKGLCSKTFFKGARCTGADQLPILEEPWEPVPIEIVGVGIGISQIDGIRNRLSSLSNFLFGARFKGHLFAGNSYMPDVMLFQAGGGSTTIMYPPGLGFALPAKPAKPDPHIHVDLHVECRPVGFRYTAWLILYYVLRP